MGDQPALANHVPIAGSRLAKSMQATSAAKPVQTCSSAASLIRRTGAGSLKERDCVYSLIIKKHKSAKGASPREEYLWRFIFLV
jgi:hypothetical protein